MRRDTNVLDGEHAQQLCVYQVLTQRRQQKGWKQLTAKMLRMVSMHAQQLFRHVLRATW
jgi:hypothetical protein